MLYIFITQYHQKNTFTNHFQFQFWLLEIHSKMVKIVQISIGYMLLQPLFFCFNKKNIVDCFSLIWFMYVCEFGEVSVNECVCVCAIVSACFFVCLE